MVATSPRWSSRSRWSSRCVGSSAWSADCPYHPLGSPHPGDGPARPSGHRQNDGRARRPDAGDAETRLPVDAWDSRDAESTAAWLRAHPGIEVVCRDGSMTYRSAITTGAPQAVQVSDRFHLWQVRREVLIDRVEVRDRAPRGAVIRVRV
ncbi:transposase [[Actinomadura] parvosata]|uniref:transposase n=1 Tax=[Actinomadura] parvosata TaxID=1955412 RepID=UPI002481D610